MYKSAVGIITRNSSTYIQECIAFNYMIGFDKIIIGLDNCDDDTAEKIQKLPDEILEHVDVFDNGIHRPDFGFQHKGYQTIYDRYKDKVEWLAMFDDDEYFYDSKRRKINDLLNGISGDVGQIVLPWLNFNHNKQVLSAPPDVTRLAHFTTLCDSHRYYPIECKVFIRLGNVVTNGNPGDWYYCHSAEVFGKIVTFDGKEQHLPSGGTSITPEHKETCLVHYITGSMEDFVNKYKNWKREKGLLNLPIGWSFDSLMQNSCDVADTRMSIYVEELKELLTKCKN